MFGRYVSILKVELTETPFQAYSSNVHVFILQTIYY